ncbi:hypothetical protein ACTHAM_002616 [Cellulomonas soli]|uniref:hypothetical protein n=1 Tax=Cellulomonas soli TaxID=931535 RepID=UPI003F87922D
MALVASTPAAARHRTDHLSWVHLPERSPSTTIDAADVGAATWHALHRDGVVRTVWGELAIARDTPETPQVRAQALARLVPERGAVARGSAAWVHTGIGAPTRIDVLVPARARRPDPHPWRVACEADLADGDVTVLGAVRVTSVQRTGVDVARLLPRVDAERVLAELLDVGFDPDAALDRLTSMAGQRGVREARALLGTDPSGWARRPARVRRG